jgi:predicted phosphodiesterase
MRLGVLADIHSNLPALQESLRFLQEEKVEGYLVLGDMVGYGPYPNECLGILQGLSSAQVVVGNHDWASVGLEDLAFFNEDAAAAIQWTKKILTPANFQFLHTAHYVLTTTQYMIVHGAPRDPLDEYLLSTESFAQNLPFLKANICFIGHSHYPLYFYKEKDSAILKQKNLQDKEEIILSPDSPCIVNPGSVGQPRDGDKRASFGIFDTQTLSFKLCRREYDIAAVQQEMQKQALPIHLAERLSEGK